MNNERKPVVGYMCRTDWDFELGEAAGGTTVYASENDLRRERKCVAHCGIVEVEVRYLRTVFESSDDTEPS